ncbi:TraE/TraK family type IV conjugative transfer system protein, partial [Klebsiella pneumoniae]
MEYRLKASNNRSLAISIVILLLIAILALGVCFRLIKVNQQLTEDLVNNRQIIIQPLGANKEFAFSGAKGDARYLRLIALSFLNLRLNVSKETVQAN